MPYTHDIEALLALYRVGGRAALAAQGILIPPHDVMCSLITQMVGQASVCWAGVPTGTFDSRRALKIADNLVDNLVEEMIKCQLPVDR